MEILILTLITIYTLIGAYSLANEYEQRCKQDMYLEQRIRELERMIGEGEG